MALVAHLYTTCDWVVLFAFDASIFFSSCLTLLAGNMWRSTLLSLMVFDINSSSFRKNQKMSQCKMFAVPSGYLARHMWAGTILYHLSTDLLPWQKLVSRSNLDLTSFAWGLQNTSYLDQIVSSWVHPWASTRKHTDPYQNHYSMLWLSCTSLNQEALQAHNLKCSHTSVST